MLILSIGFSVHEVDWTHDLQHFSETDCKHVGNSIAYFLRMHQTGDAAVDTWRRNYPQLNELFEIEGFKEFMEVITSHLLLVNKFGMIFQVSVWAALSTIDAATDIYVITTYYQTDALIGQARALLAMIITNLVIQIAVVLAQYKKKSLAGKLKEVLITLFFLRPAVDTYRVSTNHEDDGANFNSLNEMVMNKGIELATESIPGCVLQLYVWLNSPEEAGTFALVSIGVSAATTSFASAMIAFDFDVDVPHRRNQPKFYGYLPDDNGARGRCFILMTLISTLYNVSRRLGCALLAAGDRRLVVVFVGGETLLYLALKVLRGDFYYWTRLDGALAIIMSFFERVLVKIIVDYTGCLHFRHP